MFKSEKLRGICVREDWFTSGDMSQYDKLFELNKDSATLDELVLVIWICSSGVAKEQIKKVLKAEYQKMRDEYLENAKEKIVDMFEDGKSAQEIEDYYYDEMNSYLMCQLNLSVEDAEEWFSEVQDLINDLDEDD